MIYAKHLLFLGDLEAPTTLPPPGVCRALVHFLVSLLNFFIDPPDQHNKPSLCVPIYHCEPPVSQMLLFSRRCMNHYKEYVGSKLWIGGSIETAAVVRNKALG